MAYIENINVTNENGEIINVASEETVELLKKLIVLLQPLYTQDSAQRLRITVDSITGALTLGTVTTVGNANVGSLASVDARYYITDTARKTYANGIRANLTFQ